MTKLLLKNISVHGRYVIAILALLALATIVYLVQANASTNSQSTRVVPADRHTAKEPQQDKLRKLDATKKPKVKSQGNKEAGQSAAKASNQPATAPSTSSGATSGPTPAKPKPAAPQPLRVTGVQLTGAQYFCSGDYYILQIGGATISTSGSSGGQVGYKVQFDGKLSYQSYASPYFVSVAKNASYTSIAPSSDPGSLVSTHSASPGQGVRIYTTTPNVVSSAWYRIPSSFKCS